jgi:L-ascorbate metabolism protein UlaG (beta-lactamase superfamily)
MNAQQVIDKLHWLGHDTFRLDGPPVIYFDPWQLKGKLPVADLILITHEHHDHCSPDDVRKIRGRDTVILAGGSAAESLSGARAVRPGDHVSIAGVDIEAVRAYNLDKFRAPGVPFHPKESNHVGYVVTFGGVRVYHAGDTDGIPEMDGLQCDVALLPVSGKYVMTAEEAAEAAHTLNPQIAVPMHYGSSIGSPGDGKRFAKMYGGEVALLEAE